MATWIKANQVGAMFVITLVLGLLLCSLAAFTVSCGLGLLVTGAGCIAGGHWVAYLKTIGAAR